MRVLAFIMLVAAAAQAEEIEIVTRPESIYVERLAGNITPMERVFFHITLRNVSDKPLALEWVRFDLADREGTVLSGQHSGAALMRLFDSSMDRRRIEPTPRQTLVVQPDERKAISDVFLDCPAGFIGDSLVVEAQYVSDGKVLSRKTSTPLMRVAGFSGRLPFDGIWYVANEHSYLDPHKRFLAEAFAYDFIQVGASGKSYQRDGSANSDYYAYGKKVLASKNGVVVFTQTGLAEHEPGAPNVNTPGGNVVVIDHGDQQYSYYGHLRPNSIPVREGSRVRAGDAIGEVGNSGDSLEPQLHFHAMNAPNAAQADGIPTLFVNWKTQSYSRAPEPRELGSLAKGDFVGPQ